MTSAVFDLCVGDVIRVGDQLMTVIDIDGDEITVRIERAEDDEFEAADSSPHLHRPR